MKISAVVIAQNEEARLGTALRSAAFCDELLVVDGGSADRTRDVARECGAVVVDRPFDSFVSQKNFAVALAAHDAILSLDADEEVSPALRAEIEALRPLEVLPLAGYRAPRVTVYLGREIRATDWYPDWQLRFFDRRRARFTGGLVHESVKADGPTGAFAGELIHRPYRDVADHRRRIERYATLWAEQAARDGRRASPLVAWGAGSFAFLRNYVFKGGVFLGGIGLTVSRLNASYVYWKYAKLARARRDLRP